MGQQYSSNLSRPSSSGICSVSLRPRPLLSFKLMCPPQSDHRCKCTLVRDGLTDVLVLLLLLSVNLMRPPQSHHR